MNDEKIVIIGAGPCGLAAANRLEELGYTDYVVFERNHYVGGLSHSWKDDKGFTWDFAVHVLHSHYAYVDQLIAELLPNGYLHLPRKSWVREYDCWIPYPFQYNIHRLPQSVRDECYASLFHNKKQLIRPKNFLEWMELGFGAGITRHFMKPYNRKIWSVDPSIMGTQWLGDRVPAVDVDRIRRNMDTGLDDVNWGPNSHFSFPKSGGTGAIFNALAARIPSSKIRLGCEVVSIDVRKKRLVFSDGLVCDYNKLISTMPLNLLCRHCMLSDLAQQADNLRYTHNYVHCVGMSKSMPNELQDKTWIYCPEDKSCFYRVTPFSNFSENHIPGSGYSSFMCEISRPDSEKYVWNYAVNEQVIDGLQALFPNLAYWDGAVCSSQTFCAEYGYPIPTLGRDNILERVLPALQQLGIYSRGRFGAWKYEVGNMDHSIMQGVEAVESILQGTQERTWCHPDDVN